MVSLYHRKAKDLESPDRSNRFFQKALKATVTFGAVFGLNFPSNPKCEKYMDKLFYIKSFPYIYVGKDLWFENSDDFSYKFVTINFFDAKNGPEGDQNGFLVFCIYTEK